MRIPLDLLFERQMVRHTVIHTGGRGPTQDAAILVADYSSVTGLAPLPSGRPIRISIATPAFPTSIDAGIVHIEHLEQAEAIRAARRGGADARIVTGERPLSGQVELILRQGRIVSDNWCRASGATCTIRTVRGDVSINITYDPRGAPPTGEMIAFAVRFANRFIIEGPPIPEEEME